MSLCELEITGHKRFRFGANWCSFLSTLDEVRIAEAKRSLERMLEVTTLQGRTFLDIGSGSGLFSLAAMQLGAESVLSLDYDPQSVACAEELKRRYYPGDPRWQIRQGSVLSAEQMGSLGTWDVVYSWGVLHHSGNMALALSHVAPLVDELGTVFISIYNDQGWRSAAWRRVKAAYNRGALGKYLILGTFVPYFAMRGLVADLLRLRSPTERYVRYRKSRGMSLVHDWIDWLGGYPFEVAKPEEMLAFFRPLGFELQNLKTVGGGWGCNEFVFRRQAR